MMQLSSPLALCRCAILLVSLEGIVCPLFMDFVVENFGTADIYNLVVGEGDNLTGRLIFRKSPRNRDKGGQHRVIGRERVVRMLEISQETLKQEGNDPRIVSFSLDGESENYNIRFRTEKQACRFISSTPLPFKEHFTIKWARIYTHLKPVIIAYDKTDTGDINFKLLDNENYTDEYARLSDLPYVFKRSEIWDFIKKGDPHNLYLRNRNRMEDYEIKFKSAKNLDTFLEFFPGKRYNDYKTQGYYFLPNPEDGDTSQSHDTDPSESHDTDLSESHDTDPSESQDTDPSESQYMSG